MILKYLSVNMRSTFVCFADRPTCDLFCNVLVLEKTNTFQQRNWQIYEELSWDGKEGALAPACKALRSIVSIAVDICWNESWVLLQRAKTASSFLLWLKSSSSCPALCLSWSIDPGDSEDDFSVTDDWGGVAEALLILFSSKYRLSLSLSRLRVDWLFFFLGRSTRTGFLVPLVSTEKLKLPTFTSRENSLFRWDSSWMTSVQIFNRAGSPLSEAFEIIL